MGMESNALADAVRHAQAIVGWDWSRLRTRRDPEPWSYIDVLREHVTAETSALDIGTGGGEVFSEVARPTDVALDFSLEMLAVAKTNLPCPLVAGDGHALPFRPRSFEVVCERHVGVDPAQVLRVLRPGGVFVTQQVGGQICRSIFDAFGWESNGEFWRRHAAEEGRTYWNVDAMAKAYAAAGCEIVRRDESDVAYEFLDEDSLALWLTNAPLPEVVDADQHRDVLARVPLKTNWHSELLVVRMPPDA